MSIDGYFQNPELEDLNEALSKAQLVIFDMNGLIVDDEGIQLKAINQILTEFGINLSEEDWIAKYVGHSPSANYSRLVEQNPEIESNYSSETFISDWEQNYRRIIKGRVKKIEREGVLDLINYLKDSDTILAIATSARLDLVNIVLGEEGLDIIDQFKYIVTSNDVEKGQPKSEIYKTLLSRAKIPEYQCIVFEDNSSGVEAANEADIYSTVAVPNRFTQEQDFSMADYALNNLTPDAKIISS